MTDRGVSANCLEPDEKHLWRKGSGGRFTAVELSGEEKKRALDIVESVRRRYSRAKSPK